MLVVHLFSALYQGGAENQFEELFANGRSQKRGHLVVSLKSDETEFSKRLQSKGVKVVFFDFCGFKIFSELYRLKKYIQKQCSLNHRVILHCWMYHANIVGWLVALFTDAQLVWSIRRTEIPSGVTGVLARFAGLIGYLGRHKIISNSEAGKIAHEKIFYPRRIQVIKNGFDSVRKSKRTDEIDLGAECKFIHIGRFAPIKGQVQLVKAAVKFLDGVPSVDLKKVSFTFVGRDVEEGLRPLIGKTRFKECFHFLGEIDSPREILGCYSCYVLSSSSEGFPNSLAEAMLEALPCIASDVGDVSLILDDEHYIYPHNKTSHLVALISEIYSSSESRLFELGLRNRTLAVNRFNIDAIRIKYENLYNEILK